MKKNVGSFDALVRVIVGLALIAASFFLEGNLRYIGLIAIIPFATAAMGFCPLYSLFGFSSCPARN